MADRNHSRPAYQLAIAMRPIISDLVDEIVSAERGKATTRKARKSYAKDAAINRLVCLTHPPTTPPDGEGR